MLLQAACRLLSDGSCCRACAAVGVHRWLQRCRQPCWHGQHGRRRGLAHRQVCGRLPQAVLALRLAGGLLGRDLCAQLRGVVGLGVLWRERGGRGVEAVKRWRRRRRKPGSWTALRRCMHSSGYICSSRGRLTRAGGLSGSAGPPKLSRCRTLSRCTSIEAATSAWRDRLGRGKAQPHGAGASYGRLGPNWRSAERCRGAETRLKREMSWGGRSPWCWTSPAAACGGAAPRHAVTTHPPRTATCGRLANTLQPFMHQLQTLAALLLAPATAPPVAQATAHQESPTSTETLCDSQQLHRVCRRNSWQRFESGDPLQTTGSAAPAAAAHAALSGARAWRAAAGRGLRGRSARRPALSEKLACTCPYHTCSRGCSGTGRMAAPGEDVYWAFLRDYCTALKHGELSPKSRCTLRNSFWVEKERGAQMSILRALPAAPELPGNLQWLAGTRSAALEVLSGRQPSFPLGRRRAAAAARRGCRTFGAHWPRWPRCLRCMHCTLPASPRCLRSPPLRRQAQAVFADGAAGTRRHAQPGMGPHRDGAGHAGVAQLQPAGGRLLPMWCGSHVAAAILRS